MSALHRADIGATRRRVVAPPARTRTFEQFEIVRCGSKVIVALAKKKVLKSKVEVRS